MNYEYLNNIVVTVDYYNHRISTINWEIEEVITDFVDITYIISGQAEYIINGTKYTVSRGIFSVYHRAVHDLRLVLQALHWNAILSTKNT